MVATADLEIVKARGGNRWTWRLAVGGVVSAVAKESWPTEDKARRAAETAKRVMAQASTVTR